MNLFLGVDGGQSRTTALIGDQNGQMLGTGTGGPCNHAGAAEGRHKLARAVSDSVAAACAQAGLDPAATRFAAACFGMSGGPEDKRAVLQEILAVETLVVTTDAVTALAGATAGKPGIVVIAGTGSIAFGRNDQERTARAGGWGFVFGDEGGAFDIVRQALRAALRYEEGWGPPTALHRIIREATGSTDANEALHRFYSDPWPRPRIAALAPSVDQAAMDGDPIAREILHNAAQQLAMLTSSVRRQLWDPGQPVQIAWVGGVFHSLMLRERYRSLVELEDGNLTGQPQYGPAVGALLEAYRAAGLAPQLTARR